MCRAPKCLARLADGQEPRRRRLSDAYTFPGFRPRQFIEGIFGDHRARLVRLTRRGKKPSVVPVERDNSVGTIGVLVESATCPMAICGCTWRSRFGG